MKPFTQGRAGGACTSALLQVLYRDGHATGDRSWVQCLREMRGNLRAMGYDQIPQLTSSRLIDVNKMMHIVPPGSTGRRRAVLIGINYVGQQGQLSGCHNGTSNILACVGGRRVVSDCDTVLEIVMLLLPSTNASI